MIGCSYMAACGPVFDAQTIASLVMALCACATLLLSAYCHWSVNRPDVVAYLEPDDDDLVYLCVGNFGNRTAHDVQFLDVRTPNVEDADDNNHMDDFTRNGIPTLPPGVVRKTLAGGTWDKAYSDPNRTYSITVVFHRRPKYPKFESRGYYILDHNTLCSLTSEKLSSENARERMVNAVEIIAKNTEPKKEAATK